MFIYIAIIIIFIISFILALRTLKRELTKPNEIEIVKNELKKEKVLFMKD